MRITIVGGGNIGTQFAVHSAEKGHEVTIFTSTPELYDGYLNIVDENGFIIHEGNIRKATSNPDCAFRDAEYIIITIPAKVMKTVADMIYNCADSKTTIGVVPGNGGSECVFRKCIERGNVFFGIERVPAIARLVKKGKTVRSIGYRDELHVATVPRKNAEKCAEFIESIFEKKTVVIPNFLNLTITPSNPILHTARLRTLFGDWHKGVTYDRVPLFYEEWDNKSSALLIACDEEVQEICHALPEMDLQYVTSLRLHYESEDIEAMTNKISSIKAFKGLVSPMVKVKDGFVPDLHSRYFTSDFSYGLTIIKQVADFVGIPTPNIDETMEWYKSIAVETEEFRFENYGIIDRKTLEQFYMQ